MKTIWLSAILTFLGSEFGATTKETLGATLV
jgi:hypothetical protein